MKKMKPYHVVLIILMLALTVALYVYKDSIIPDVNAPYREQLAKYESAEAEVIEIGYDHGRHGSNFNVTVRFTASDGEVYTCKVDDNALEGTEKGDRITVYYDPAAPAYKAKSEGVYKEVMKIK